MLLNAEGPPVLRIIPEFPVSAASDEPWFFYRQLPPIRLLLSDAKYASLVYGRTTMIDEAAPASAWPD